ncbi:MAG: sigma-70 family RNA polymerase sigma factor [Micrococcales bacterium]|nr:sigma-70 family RNA polymerase sigma factor [Micrococcales bacterium]
MAIEGPQRSDAELLAAVRAGDADGYGTLYDRHAIAALNVARQYTNSAADAEDVVADSFAAVYTALQRGKGPTEAFRAYLYTVVRRVATLHRDHGRRVQPTDDDTTLHASGVTMAGADAPALAGFESSAAARAFTSLPERWQVVLWHTELEGLSPAEVAPLLGLSANSAAALAYRAREGLRQAYLNAHLAGGVPDLCRPVTDKLGAYVRGGLGARESRKVAEHLDQCAACTALHGELGDVNRQMRAVVGPLVLGFAGMGALGPGLPVGGGIAALGSLVGLSHTPVAAGTAGGSAAAGAGAGATASAGGGLSLPVVGAVAAVLVVAVGVAVYALTGDAPAPAQDPVTVAVSPTARSTPVVTPLDVTTHPVQSGDDVVRDDPTGVPVVDPTGVPADPVVVPASFALNTGGSPLTLRAGASGQELRLPVHNSGGEATGLVAGLTLPAGVTLDWVPAVAGGGFAVPASSWGCVSTTQSSATCTLTRLGANQTAELVVLVSVAEDYSGHGGALDMRLSHGQGTSVHLAVPVAVNPAPARVLAAVGGPVTFVSNRTVTVPVSVSNLGGQVAAAVVVVQVPYGVHLGGPQPPGWACAPTGLTTITCTAAVPARTSLPLDLPLAATDVTGVGTIVITYSPSAQGGTVVVPYTAVTPATLAVTGALGTLAVGVPTELSLTVTNTGDLPCGPVSVDVSLPAGVVAAGAVGAGWTCTGTQCTHAGLAPGEGSSLTIAVSATVAGSLGDIVVTPSAHDADAEAVQIPVVAATAPGSLTARMTAAGNVRVVQVGAPLVSCTAEPGCAGYLDGVANNDGLAMSPLDTDPPAWPRPAQPVSSATTLSYPAGQAVLWAGLYWSANAGPSDTWSTDRASVALRGPGGAYQNVTGEVLAEVTDGAGWQYYQSFAEVTTQVLAAGPGTWALADAAVSATFADPAPNYYAGWALVVIYGNPGAVGSRTVTVYDGGQWVSGVAQPVLAAWVGAGAQVTVGAVAWEGDAATTGDQLFVDSTALTPLRWDGSPGSSSNAFDSTATGWGRRNSLGVDAKAFAPVTAAAPTIAVRASASGDQYLLGVLTITTG